MEKGVSQIPWRISSHISRILLRCPPPPQKDQTCYSGPNFAGKCPAFFLELLFRGLLKSHADGSTLRCDLPAIRSNLSLLSDPSLQLTSLHLPVAALAGSLPLELGEFSSLRSLNLAVNSLSSEVPLELGNSPSLSDLDLSGNIITSSLPPPTSETKAVNGFLTGVAVWKI